MTITTLTTIIEDKTKIRELAALKQKDLIISRPGSSLNESLLMYIGIKFVSWSSVCPLEIEKDVSSA